MLLSLASAAAAGPTVRDEKLAITLSLPDGFEPMPGFRRPAGQNIPYAFQRRDLGENVGTMVCIQVLDGVIGREEPPADLVGKNGVIRLYREKWKSFDLDVVVIREINNSSMFLTRNVMIPTKPKAIILRIFGPDSKDAEMAALARDLLASLNGETNWVTKDKRYERLGEGMMKMALWLVGIGVVTNRIVRSREGAFRRGLLARGLPPEVAYRKIRPGWAWYLLVGYVLYGGVALAGVMLFTWNDRHVGLLYSLGISVAAILVAVACLVVIMRARSRGKRRILTTPPPLPDAPGIGSILTPRPPGGVL